MSPIKDVSDIRRMPRLGKIRLGIKIEELKQVPEIVRGTLESALLFLTVVAIV